MREAFLMGDPFFGYSRLELLRVRECKSSRSTCHDLNLT